VMARGGDSRPGIAARPAGAHPRPVATAPGHQAMNLTAPRFN
jgi:hypothetical protein